MASSAAAASNTVPPKYRVPSPSQVKDKVNGSYEKEYQTIMYMEAGWLWRCGDENAVGTGKEMDSQGKKRTGFSGKETANDRERKQAAEKVSQIATVIPCYVLQ